MSNINDDFDILSIEESIQPPSAPEIDDFSKEINQDVNFDLKGALFSMIGLVFAIICALTFNISKKGI